MLWLRINEICVNVEKNSKIVFSDIQRVLECKLEEITSKNNFNVVQKNMQLIVNFQSYILFQTANKIVDAFLENGMQIEKVCWTRKMKGPFKRGYLEIIIS